MSKSVFVWDLCLPELDVGQRPAASPGINRTYLNKLENGASYPGLEIIATLVTVLEVEPAELLTVPIGTEPMRRVLMSRARHGTGGLPDCH